MDSPTSRPAIAQRVIVSVIKNTFLPWSLKYSHTAVAVNKHFWRISGGWSPVEHTKTDFFIPSGPRASSINSLTSRPRSPISATTLTSASEFLAIIPSNVLLPTPEPANNPIRCPQPNVIQESIALTPVENISWIIGRSNGPGGGPSTFLQVAPVVSIGFPSIGSPIGFINLPSKKSPTGIIIGCPVVWTKLPCPIPAPSYNKRSWATSPLKATTSAGFFSPFAASI